MSEHARYAPSSLARLMACPGSYVMSQGIKSEDSAASLEGTAAHEVGAVLLTNSGAQLPGVTSTGEIITPDMIDGATLYAEYVRAVADGAEIHTEARIYCTGIHPTDCWGTADAWFDNGEVLNVFDFKFGRVFVDPVENWQLIAYASGIKSESPRIRLHIIQPRSYGDGGPCRSWTLGREELDKYTREIAETIRSIEDGSALTRPRDDCRYCPARVSCQALHDVTAVIHDYAATPVKLELSPDDLGIELRMSHQAADLLKFRISGLEAQAEALLRDGQRVPNYTLDRVWSREAWAVEDDEVAAFGQSVGVDIMHPPKPLTPVQAKKKLKDYSVLIESMTTKTSSLELKPLLKNAKRIFSQ